MAIPLSYEDRTRHLPKLLRDGIARLRLKVGTKTPISIAANHHGDLRHEQGYSVATVVEESRLLQVSLFTTLHKIRIRLSTTNYQPDVVTIAEEVNAHLKQQMPRYREADAIG